ncbi:MAG: TonB-dependent receptor, partial [Bacteroidales bacterium]
MFRTIHKNRLILVFTTILLLLPQEVALSQPVSVIRGKVTDRTTGESLVGATIMINDTTGISSGMNGDYLLNVYPGTYTLTSQFIGYHPFKTQINIKPYDTVRLNIKLEVNINVLEEIVVTAGKFSQKLSDVTVSMDVIKPIMIRQNSDITMEMVINRMPG